jgi:hypothetical protein
MKLTIFLLLFSLSAQGQFIIDSYRFGAPAVPINEPLLDSFPTAAAAYSLRLLRTGYTGNCIQVRRASDNTTQNIGFVANYLDTASLKTFCSGTDCFVAIWYDQSTNGNNATQTTNGRQPRIVSSGNINYAQGRAGVQFGVNDSTVLQANGLLSLFDSLNMPFSAFVAALKSDSTTIGQILRARQLTAEASIQTLLLLDSPNNFLNYLTRNTSFNLISSSSTSKYTLNYSLFSWLYSGSTINFYTNNSINGSISHSHGTVTFTPNAFTIGNEVYPSAYARFPFIGTISEIITYPVNQTTNVSAIHTNINNFYQIY